MHPALRRAKYLVDGHTPLATQVALAQFIGDGLFAQHVRRMRRVYQERHERVVAAFARAPDDLFEPLPTTGGLHIAVRLRQPAVDDQALVARGREMGLGFRALSDFAPAGSPHRGVILGYGAIPVDRIERGLHLLRHCLNGTDKRGRR